MKQSSVILAVIVAAMCSLPQASRAQTVPAPPAPPVLKAPAEPARPGTPEYAYRLHYTLTEMNGSKQVDVQHLSLTVAPGQSNNNINLSSRVPVPAVPHSPNAATSGTATIGVQTQFQYLDVGTRISAFVKMLYEGVQITTSVNQSRLAEVPVGDGTMTIIRQANLDSSVILSPGKLVRVGSMDVPGSTQHFDVDLMLEEVK
jgi:hypothetical protein